MKTIIEIQERLKKLGLVHTYIVLPSTIMSYAMVKEYFQALGDAALCDRFSDQKNPNIEWAARHFVKANGESAHSFFVMKTDTGELVCEFTLNGFQHKCAQVHFSMLPSLPARVKLFLADEVTNQILRHWKTSLDSTEPFLQSIVGITPIPNQTACKFIRKAGFISKGTIAGATMYHGRVCNAGLTVKQGII